MTCILKPLLSLMTFLLLSSSLFGQDIAKLDFEPKSGICKFESNGTVDLQKLGFTMKKDVWQASKKVSVFHSTKVIVVRAAKTKLNLTDERKLTEIRGFLSSGHTTGYHPNRMVPVLFYADKRFTEIGSAFFECWPAK